jgi:hypothetical protein
MDRRFLALWLRSCRSTGCGAWSPPCLVSRLPPGPSPATAVPWWLPRGPASIQDRRSPMPRRSVPVWCCARRSHPGCRVAAAPGALDAVLDATDRNTLWHRPIPSRALSRRPIGISRSAPCGCWPSPCPWRSPLCCRTVRRHSCAVAPSSTGCSRPADRSGWSRNGGARMPAARRAIITACRPWRAAPVDLPPAGAGGRRHPRWFLHGFLA